MIRYENITVRRGGRAILNAVTAEAPARSLTLLLGRSGSGKSTLLRLVNRLGECDSGSVIVEGQDVRHADVYSLRRSIGFVPQSLGLFPHRTAAEHLLLAGRGQANIAELLAQVELPFSYANRYPRELSGGEQQRLALARALAAQGHSLLLDEAFSALDPILRRELTNLVGSLGKTTILASHDPATVLPFARHVIFLERGELAFAGSVLKFRESAHPLIRQYLEASRC